MFCIYLSSRDFFIKAFFVLKKTLSWEKGTTKTLAEFKVTLSNSKVGWKKHRIFKKDKCEVLHLDNKAYNNMDWEQFGQLFIIKGVGDTT